MATDLGTNLFAPSSSTDATAGISLTNEFRHAMEAKAALAGAAPPTTTGIYAKGCRFVDTTQTAGKSPVWFNTGDNVTPVWAQDNAASAPSSTGTGVVQVAHMKYSFATDGGASGAITPVLTAALPINAVILGGVINVTTQLTSGGSATISLGTTAGSSASSLLGATAVASWTVGGGLVVVPKFTTASLVKMTAAGSLNLTVAAADLTAGVFEVIVQYFVALA